jgi:hypothetical protein
MHVVEDLKVHLFVPLPSLHGIHGIQVALNVKNLRIGSQVRFDYLSWKGGQQLSDLALGVPHIPEDSSPTQAGLHAGWFNSRIHAVPAELTFLNDSFQRVDGAHVIRAGGHAVFAPDAAMRVNHHDAILALPGSLDWAVGQADGIIAIITQRR